MTNKTNEIKTTDMYRPDPRTFGGIISEFDFNGHTYIQNIASKIFLDWQFDDTYTRIANYMTKITGNK